jgi:hypothetical protein
MLASDMRREMGAHLTAADLHHEFEAQKRALIADLAAAKDEAEATRKHMVAALSKRLAKTGWN